MEKKLLIEGMSCNHCVNHVRTALTEDIKGVEVREVSLDGKYAIVNMDDSVKEEELKALIADLGFELKGIQWNGMVSKEKLEIIVQLFLKNDLLRSFFVS